MNLMFKQLTLSSTLKAVGKKPQQKPNQNNNKHNSLSAKPFNVKGEILQMKGKTKRLEFSFKE